MSLSCLMGNHCKTQLAVVFTNRKSSFNFKKFSLDVIATLTDCSIVFYISVFL